MGVDVGLDGGLKLRRGAVGASPDGVVGQQREEPLDLVDPGGRGRRVVDVTARPFGAVAVMHALTLPRAW